VRAGLIGLWRWTAWGGIGLSLYAGWLTADDIRDRASSERDISAACDRLVSGAAVMDLQGGMVRAEADDYDEFRLDARELYSSCRIYRVPQPWEDHESVHAVGGAQRPLPADELDR